MPAWRLFERVGIELEYMIVDADTIEIRPWSDRLLRSESGAPVSDLEHGPVTWSNELVAHVLEVKMTEPAVTLEPWPGHFAQSIREINRRLAAHSARLLPTGMHPWMNPLVESEIWKHEFSEVYAAFDRIFDCRGHGWSNLQSMHVNLPFSDDREFGLLHAAVRVLLPILPALAASSPLQDGRFTGQQDSRLEAYRGNCRRLPEILGKVIPERVFDQAEYHRQILQPMYAAIAPFDSAGVLQEEFLNARGAIARFERGSIEVRVLDVQECPLADLAIAAAVVAVCEALITGTWCDPQELRPWSVEELERIFLATVRQGHFAPIESLRYARLFGYAGPPSLTAAGLWRHILTQLSQSPKHDPWKDAWQVFMKYGTLAHRIALSLPPESGPDSAEFRNQMKNVYRRLADCLEANQLFVPFSGK